MKLGTLKRRVDAHDPPPLPDGMCPAADVYLVDAPPDGDTDPEPTTPACRRCGRHHEILVEEVIVDADGSPVGASEA